MKNLDVRKAIFNAGLRHWQVAQKVGCSEATFSRWLRYDMSTERKRQILQAVESLAGGANET